MHRLVALIIGIVVGMLGMTCFDAVFEKRSCQKLEAELNVNLAYTYNTGCVRAESL